MSLAQSETVPSDDELSYYLIQAFHANTTKLRQGLNHIGIQTEPTNGGHLVTAVLEDFPAHNMGLVRGDIIHSADGNAFHPVHSFNPQARAIEFAASKRQYSLQWRRRSTEMQASITPVFENLYDSYRSASLNSMQKFSAGNKILGYVRLWGFSRSTNDLSFFARLMSELGDCDGLIFDLRNSYGFLSPQHLDQFFPSRRRYFSVDPRPKEHDAYSSADLVEKHVYFQQQVAVLINSQTKGDAELFAYQLAKLERIITLGEPTPGKTGSYSEDPQSHELYYSPANANIDDAAFEGLEPEQSVPYPFAQSSSVDPQYEAAVLILLGII